MKVPTHSFYIVFQVLKVFSYFFYNTVTRSSNSYCFASVSISADVIFHNFLEFHSTLSEKGFFMNVLFINGFVYQPKYILKLFLLGQEINMFKTVN